MKACNTLGAGSGQGQRPEVRIKTLTILPIEKSRGRGTEIRCPIRLSVEINSLPDLLEF